MSRRFPLWAVLVLLVLLVATAACTGPESDVPDAPESTPATEAAGTETAGAETAPAETAATAPTGADEARPPLPDGAQAVSLLGEPLYAPALAEEARAGLEADYATAMAELEADPEGADALIWAGRRAAYLGRYREAIAIFTRGIELHPDDARFLRHRGHRWITVRELDRAVADLRRATELVAGTEDRIEPDGQPNELGIPVSTLHFNIWYHLALAHYLKGELEQALLAWNACMDVSRHPDTVVATAYWLNNTALRLGLEETSDDVLGRITPDMDIIESTSYLEVLLLHRGLRSLDDVVGPEGAPTDLDDVTTAYGVGNWHHVNGRVDEAFRVWEGILEGEGPWAAFGYLAAEAELARR